MDRMSRRSVLKFGKLSLSGACAIGVVLAFALAGCSNPVSKMMFTNHKQRNPAMAPEKQRERGEEQAHRANYRSTRSSEDLDWLMRNRIENGLTLESVNNILGEKGERTDAGDEDGIAQAGGASESKDGTYEYGPDDKGRSYRLTFRNSRLVEFNPSLAAEERGVAQASMSKKESKLKGSDKKDAGRVSLE